MAEIILGAEETQNISTVTEGQVICIQNLLLKFEKSSINWTEKYFGGNEKEELRDRITEYLEFTELILDNIKEFSEEKGLWICEEMGKANKLILMNKIFPMLNKNYKGRNTEREEESSNEYPLEDITLHNVNSPEREGNENVHYKFSEEDLIVIIGGLKGSLGSLKNAVTSMTQEMLSLLYPTFIHIFTIGEFNALYNDVLEVLKWIIIVIPEMNQPIISNIIESLHYGVDYSKCTSMKWKSETKNEHQLISGEYISYPSYILFTLLSMSFYHIPSTFTESNNQLRNLHSNCSQFIQKYITECQGEDAKGVFRWLFMLHIRDIKTALFHLDFPLCPLLARLILLFMGHIMASDAPVLFKTYCLEIIYIWLELSLDLKPYIQRLFSKVIKQIKYKREGSMGSDILVCMECGSNIDQASIECSICKQEYHRECVGQDITDPDSIPRIWNCKSCIRKSKSILTADIPPPLPKQGKSKRTNKSKKQDPELLELKEQMKEIEGEEVFLKENILGYLDNNKKNNGNLELGRQMIIGKWINKIHPDHSVYANLLTFYERYIKKDKPLMEDIISYEDTKDYYSLLLYIEDLYESFSSIKNIFWDITKKEVSYFLVIKALKGLQVILNDQNEWTNGNLKIEDFLIWTNEERAKMREISINIVSNYINLAGKHNWRIPKVVITTIARRVLDKSILVKKCSIDYLFSFLTNNNYQEISISEVEKYKYIRDLLLIIHHSKEIKSKICNGFYKLWIKPILTVYKKNQYKDMLKLLQKEVFSFDQTAVTNKHLNAMENMANDLYSIIEVEDMDVYLYLLFEHFKNNVKEFECILDMIGCFTASYLIKSRENESLVVLLSRVLKLISHTYPKIMDKHIKVFNSMLNYAPTEHSDKILHKNIFSLFECCCQNTNSFATYQLIEPKIQSLIFTPNPCLLRNSVKLLCKIILYVSGDRIFMNDTLDKCLVLLQNVNGKVKANSLASIIKAMAIIGYFCNYLQISEYIHQFEHKNMKELIFEQYVKIYHSEPVTVREQLRPIVIECLSDIWKSFPELIFESKEMLKEALNQNKSSNKIKILTILYNFLSQTNNARSINLQNINGKVEGGNKVGMGENADNSISVMSRFNIGAIVPYIIDDLEALALDSDHSIREIALNVITIIAQHGYVNFSLLTRTLFILQADYIERIRTEAYDILTSLNNKKSSFLLQDLSVNYDAIVKFQLKIYDIVHVNGYLKNLEEVVGNKKAKKRGKKEKERIVKETKEGILGKYFRILSHKNRLVFLDKLIQELTTYDPIQNSQKCLFNYIFASSSLIALNLGTLEQSKTYANYITKALTSHLEENTTVILQKLNKPTKLLKKGETKWINLSISVICSMIAVQKINTLSKNKNKNKNNITHYDIKEYIEILPIICHNLQLPKVKEEQILVVRRMIKDFQGFRQQNYPEGNRNNRKGGRVSRLPKGKRPRVMLEGGLGKEHGKKKAKIDEKEEFVYSNHDLRHKPKRKDENEILYCKCKKGEPIASEIGDMIECKGKSCVNNNWIHLGCFQITESIAILTKRKNYLCPNCLI